MTAISMALNGLNLLLMACSSGLCTVFRKQLPAPV
jgi:hypothetical protein